MFQVRFWLYYYHGLFILKGDVARNRPESHILELKLKSSAGLTIRTTKTTIEKPSHEKATLNT